jgi:hypothetical protein
VKLQHEVLNFNRGGFPDTSAGVTCLEQQQHTDMPAWLSIVPALPDGF